MAPYCRVVAPRSIIHTDGWCGYAELPAAGYRHQLTVIRGGREPAHEFIPSSHIVAALLKVVLCFVLCSGGV